MILGAQAMQTIPTVIEMREAVDVDMSDIHRRRSSVEEILKDRSVPERVPEGPCTPRNAPLSMAQAWSLLFRIEALINVKKYLKKLGVHRRDRAEVAQTVFEEVIKSFPTYDPLRSRPERWLNCITVHVASKYLRKAVHRREQLMDPIGLDVVSDSDGTSVHDALALEERREFLFEILQRLPADDAWILVKYHLDELSIEQVATIRGISASTVYKWRARFCRRAEHRARTERVQSIRRRCDWAGQRPILMRPRDVRRCSDWPAIQAALLLDDWAVSAETSAHCATRAGNEDAVEAWTSAAISRAQVAATLRCGRWGESEITETARALVSTARNREVVPDSLRIWMDAVLDRAPKGRMLATVRSLALDITDRAMAARAVAIVRWALALRWLARHGERIAPPGLPCVWLCGASR